MRSAEELAEVKALLAALTPSRGRVFSLSMGLAGSTRGRSCSRVGRRRSSNSIPTL
jgi:hypothetical protein